MAQQTSDKTQIELLINNAKKSSSEIAQLKTQISQLETQLSNFTVPNKIPKEEDIDTLKLENCKLTYQLTHLQKVLAEQQQDTMATNNVQQLIQRLVAVAIYRAFPQVSTPPAASRCQSDPKNLADYRCGAPLSLSKAVKDQTGAILHAKKIAEQINNNFPSNTILDECIISDVGFLNLTLNKDFVCRSINDILHKGVQPPNLAKKRVIVDFSSPNIAKEMHVGHLRSTIIGESICRLLEFCGHDVLRLNHVGDWGTQFGMLIAHIQEKYPDYEKQTTLPISDLQELYKVSKTRFDEEEDFKTRAYQAVVALQNRDPQFYNAWQKICDISRAEFQALYDRLDISIIERGESYYQPLMPLVVEDLESKGLIKTEEGRKLLFPPGVTPLTLVKSDGGYTYDTSDVAAIRHRIEEEKGDWLIYVVDRGQATHFESIFAAAKYAGYLDEYKVRVNHVEFGVVLGEDKKKFKTRSGETVRLAELLDEGLERSLATLKMKERDKVLSEEELKAAQEAVAYGCIKYADLSHDRTRDYVFSYDKMLEDKGNTAVYLLYMLTRIRSIIRSCKLTPEQIHNAIGQTPIILDDPLELALGKLLIRFPEILFRTVDSLLLHQICDYLYELAYTFSRFYDKCYCIRLNKETGEVTELNMPRILLCEATARTLETGFHIVGLQPVSRM